MFYYRYSPEQLERAAEQLLQKFDPELLKKPKEYDVYRVIEECLGVDYDWKYIRPDQVILGLTAFNPGYIWVSPAPHLYEGIQPERIYLEKGTILIDATLTEGNNIGRERFTVMHEVFHQVLHKDCFRREPPDYVHQTTKCTLFGQKKKLVTALDHIEYQANTCAADFLMPRKTVPTVWRSISGFDRPAHEDYRTEDYIRKIAQVYQVSRQAMRYRLRNLQLIVPPTTAYLT